MKRRARIIRSPALSVRRSTNFASALMTSMPSAAKRSAESCGRERGDHLLDVVVDAAEIDLGLVRRHPEGGGHAYGLGPRRGGRQRLGWDAAEMESCPAHAVGFDQNNGRAIAAGRLGGGEAGGSGADDANVRGKQARHRLGQDAPGPEFGRRTRFTAAAEDHGGARKATRIRRCPGRAPSR